MPDGRTMEHVGLSGGRIAFRRMPPPMEPGSWIYDNQLPNPTELVPSTQEAIPEGIRDAGTKDRVKNELRKTKTRLALRESSDRNRDRPQACASPVRSGKRRNLWLS